MTRALESTHCAVCLQETIWTVQVKPKGRRRKDCLSKNWAQIDLLLAGLTVDLTSKLSYKPGLINVLLNETIVHLFFLNCNKLEANRN